MALLIKLQQEADVFENDEESSDCIACSIFIVRNGRMETTRTKRKSAIRKMPGKGTFRERYVSRIIRNWMGNFTL